MAPNNSEKKSVVKRIVNAVQFLKKNGMTATLKKTIYILSGRNDDFEYTKWYKKTRVTASELKHQKKASLEFDEKPKYGFVIPVYDTPDIFLKKLIKSLENQSYGKFEVFFSDATEYDSSETSNDPRAIIERVMKSDTRFHYIKLDKNNGISVNTNAAIDQALKDETIEFIVLTDHDDELTPDALYECTKAINDNPLIRVIYSDEDKTDKNSSYFFEPHMKSDYNPDMLRSVNYFCHLFMARRDIVTSISETDADGTEIYEKKEYDGAQDYDLILRCCEKAEELDRELEDKNRLPENIALMKSEGIYTSATIHHIPRVLYHWRSHQASTASDPAAKMYAFDAGAEAIKAHCLRTGLPFESIETGADLGFYHVTYKTENPLISVIIPNKDHTDDLDKVIRSLTGGEYKNLEFIVVENNSTEKKTWDYYDEIQKEFENVRVVKWEKEFNYSAINNYGISYATGDYILFMNNDIELISDNAIREMLMYVQRDDVGICGAKLLYPDDSIQHAGVVIGFGGIAGAAFVTTPKGQFTYMHRAQCIQDYSSVTAAVMMSKRSVIDAVGGFSMDLAVAFNDIDFCMKVRALGLKVVYDPYALFHHYESKSRGLEDTPEKLRRFHNEMHTFLDKWPAIVKNGDPYYNAQLTLRKADFSLRNLLLENIGEPYSIDFSYDDQE